MKRFVPKVLSTALLTLVTPFVLALGNPEFVPATGVLVLKAVDVNGVKTYENVEIHLNMATGTFRIPKASPADNRIPEVPVQEVSKNGLKVGMRGCLAVRQSVTCHIVLTALEFNRTVKIGGTQRNSFYWETSVFDNRGNTYRPDSLTVSNTNATTFVEKALIANVPTLATITVENVSTSATSFSSVIFKIQDVDRGLAIFGDFEFKNVPF